MTRRAARFPQLGGAWSPDGRYLAFSRPSREPSILIVGTDSGKVLATLEHATQPAWSPDGSRCAFIRTKNDSNSLCLVERHGQTFAPSRQFIETGSVRATPGWSSDSRSIFVVAEKSTTRLRELELDRVSAQTGDSGRVLNLIAEPALRGGSLRGVAIDFDRDGERCFFSVDIEGRESDLGVGIIRDQHIPKRFPLIDASLRIGALAVSPNDRYLAIRFGPPGSLTPPALYDLALEQTTLIVPDDNIKAAMAEHADRRVPELIDIRTAAGDRGWPPRGAPHATTAPWRIAGERSDQAPAGSNCPIGVPPLRPTFPSS